MATIEQCVVAFTELAARLASADPATRGKAALDRSVSCRLSDLDVIFAGRLHDGELTDLHPVTQSDGQIKLTMTSDDLILLTKGELNLVSSWAAGRIKIEASVMDLIKLRGAF